MWHWLCNKITVLALWLVMALPIGAAGAQEVVLTFGGDVNFARTRATPQPDRVIKFTTLSLDQATQNLAPFWAEGDLNIVNVETVVSARNGQIQGKTFVFRSHPAQFRHLMALGVNGFSLANNHAWDHGLAGLYDTHRFFAEAARAEPMLFAGTGQGDAALAPNVIAIGPVRVAMASLSFGGARFAPGPMRYGMASLDNPDHVDAVLAGLRAVDADLKILTLHWGAENRITLEAGQAAFVERAFEEAGVHLVLGHHPHVVRGVEVRPDTHQAAFYSLGNLLFIGGSEKDSEPIGRDYGLLGQAVFQMGADGPRLTALGAVPLKGVHQQPRLMQAWRANRTIAALNRLSRSDLGAQAARFTLRPDAPTQASACFAPPYGPFARALCCAASTAPHCTALPDLM